MLKADNRHWQAVQQLLERTRLSPTEIEQNLQKATDAAYWARLIPDLTLERSELPWPTPTAPADAQQQEKLLAMVATKGYFQTDPILPPAMTSRMRHGIDVLRKEGWPPAFAFVYDEFWLASRHPSLVRLLNDLLGSNYTQNGHVWTHYVASAPIARGWAPHFDGLNRPNRITVWLALSDATLDNGCMYVVPKDAIPRRMLQSDCSAGKVDWAEAKSMLHACRALPTPAGAALGWTFDVLHWGSVWCGGEPRMSISMEFLGGEVTELPDEMPLINPGADLPSLGKRLHAVCGTILAYKDFDPLLIRYVELAEQLLLRCAGN